MENNNKFELFWPKIINIWERKGKLADIVVSVLNPNSKKFELKIFSNCEILNIQNLNLVKYKCPLSKKRLDQNSRERGVYKILNF